MLGPVHSDTYLDTDWENRARRTLWLAFVSFMQQVCGPFSGTSLKWAENFADVSTRRVWSSPGWSCLLQDKVAMPSSHWSRPENLIEMLLSPFQAGIQHHPTFTQQIAEKPPLHSPVLTSEASCWIRTLIVSCYVYWCTKDMAICPTTQSG